MTDRTQTGGSRSGVAEVCVEAQKGNENVTRLSDIPTSVPGRKQERGEVAAVPVWLSALRLLPRSLHARHGHRQPGSDSRALCPFYTSFLGFSSWAVSHCVQDCSRGLLYSTSSIS